MATIEGGISLDPGGLSSQASQALSAVLAQISTPSASTESALAGGGKIIESESARGTLKVVQPSTAENSTAPASDVQVTPPTAPVRVVADVPAGVILAVEAPASAISARDVVSSTVISNAETKSVVTELSAAAPGVQLAVQTVVPVAASQGAGKIVLEASANTNSTVEGGAVAVMVLNTENLSNNVEVEVRGVKFLVLDGGAAASNTTSSHTTDEFNPTLRIADGGTVVVGSSKSEVVFGGAAGADHLRGLSGKDYLYGGAGGNSSIEGGSGTDVLVGGTMSGAGGNTVEGGSGNDVLVASGAVTQGLVTWFGQNQQAIENIDSLNEYAGLRDLVDALSGADTRARGDTFKFADSSGVDMVFNFHVDADVLLFKSNVNGSGLRSVADLTGKAVQNGANVHVLLGGGNEVVLVGVNLSDLSNDNFGFY